MTTSATPPPKAKLGRSRQRSGDLGAALGGTSGLAPAPAEPITPAEPVQVKAAREEPVVAVPDPEPTPAPRATPLRSRRDEDEDDDGYVAPAFRGVVDRGPRAIDDALHPEGSSEATFQTAVYAPERVVSAAKLLTKVTPDATYASIAMDAIDAAIEAGVLGDLVSDSRTVERPEGSRFPSRRQTRPRARAVSSGGGGTQWPLQMTAAEREALDDLVAEHQAPSRSALVAAAMGWYVTIPKIRQRLSRGR